ncbi:hypothetical protein ACSIZT_002039, partial [Yersinia enterocolitica]
EVAEVQKPSEVVTHGTATKEPQSKPQPQKVEIAEVPKPVVSKPGTSWSTVQVFKPLVASVGSSNSGANQRPPSTQATDPGLKLPTSGTGGTVIGSPGSAGAPSFTNRPASSGPAVSHNTFIEKTPSGAVEGKVPVSKQDRIDEAKKEFPDVELRQQKANYDGKTSMNSGVRIMPEKTITGEHYSQEFSEKAQKYNAYS